MRTETLADTQSKTIGYTETGALGKQTAKTAHLVTVGDQGPRTNWTADSHFLPGFVGRQPG